MTFGFYEGCLEWLDETDDDDSEIIAKSEEEVGDHCASCNKHLDAFTWEEEGEKFQDYIYDKYSDTDTPMPVNLCAKCAIREYEFLR